VLEACLHTHRRGVGKLRRYLFNPAKHLWLSVPDFSDEYFHSNADPPNHARTQQALIHTQPRSKKLDDIIHELEQDMAELVSAVLLVESHLCYV
jgi:hypothetical protein